MRLGWLALSGVACTGAAVDPLEGPPSCDGRLQASEGKLDAYFDRDRDGYVDGADPQCAETYGAWFLDCDDGSPSTHPEASERACNNVDDDCNPDTPDALDHDGDGTIACDDCDDDDPRLAPGQTEICWDNLDNDCDGLVDPGCGPNYNGDFGLDRDVQFDCLGGYLVVDFSEVSIVWIPPYASFVAIASPTPGAMNGDIADNGAFHVETAIDIGTGACSANFAWYGSFSNADQFEGDLTLDVAGALCSGCGSKIWHDIVGTRIFTTY